jgi:hypothetical protein
VTRGRLFAALALIVAGYYAGFAAASLIFQLNYCCSPIYSISSDGWH